MAEKVEVGQKKKPAGNMGMFVVLFMMLFMLVIAMDPVMREGVGTIAGFALEPVVGFNYTAPIWTVFFAALIVSIISGVVRQFVMDWEKTGAFQKKQAYISKLSRNAFKSRDMAKLDKINKLRSEMMQESMEVQTSQMKPTAITGLLFFALLMWMYIFMATLSHSFISVPWADGYSVDLNFMHWLPDWMFFYMLVSLVLGQVIGRALRYFFFSRELRKVQAQGG